MHWWRQDTIAGGKYCQSVNSERSQVILPEKAKGIDQNKAVGSGTPKPGGQEGQGLPFIMNSFHLSYLLKGHFPAFQSVW